MSGQARFTAGLDVGGTHIRGVVLDASCKVIASSMQRQGHDKSPKAVCGLIQGTLSDLGRDAEVSKSALGRVGVGLAGWIDQSTGTVANAPNLDWRNVPFGRLLGRRLKGQVLLCNDLTAVTFGEWRLGAARGFDDVLSVFVGSGLGAGLILDGRVYEGARGMAAELGHITVVPGGSACGCGARGCLEAYVGGRYLEDKMRRGAARGKFGKVLKAAHGKPEAITVASLQAAVRAKDPEALALLASASGHLATGLATAIKILNPACLILGGGVIENLPSLFTQTLARLPGVTPAPFLHGLAIQKSALGPLAGAIGAALLARDASVT